MCLAFSSQLVSEVYGAKALYSFGDSYLDTGNSNVSNDGLSWNQPYGITWPGYPDGRASNGLLQLDYIGKFYNFFFNVQFKISSFFVNLNIIV